MQQSTLNQIIDANLNRVSEGLRVLEEYARFVAGNKPVTDQLATFRKEINAASPNRTEELNSRDTHTDTRAKEHPTKRPDLSALLTANCKRITEGLRVLEEYTGDALYNRIRYDMYDMEKELCLGLLKPNIKPGIYLVTDDIEVMKKGIHWGVSLIQLRDKTATKGEIYAKACEARRLFETSDIPFLINDYLDIARDINADGLHTGQDDIPIAAQRKLLGPHKLIGRTTHSLEQGLAAQTDGADYVSVGPIWDTPSKPGRPGIGFDYLKSATTQLHVPFVAIGGINIENIENILPYSPPLVGLIRDYEHIPDMQKHLENCI